MFATGSHDGTVQFWTSSSKDATKSGVLCDLRASRPLLERISSIADPDQISWMSQEFIVPGKGKEEEKSSYDGDDGDDYSGNGKDTEEPSSNGDEQSFRSVVSQRSTTLLYGVTHV